MINIFHDEISLIKHFLKKISVFQLYNKKNKLNKEWNALLTPCCARIISVHNILFNEIEPLIFVGLIGLGC